jgi:DNA-binding transcriptional LysR family regulator
MINLKQLHIFYEAAKTLNFSKAAENFNITQPAVSTQIKLLEIYLAMKLFKRVGRKMQLTEAGDILKEYAEKIFHITISAEKALDGLKTLRHGTLRLGTTKNYARYLMPSLIAKFHSLYPGIKIMLDEGSSLEVTRSLFDLKNELAIVAKIEDRKGIHFIPFTKEELVLVLSPRNPLTHKRPVPFQALAKEPWIMREFGSGIRRVTEELFKKYRISPQVVMETSNSDFIKDLIRQGEGVALMAKSAVAEEVAKKELVILPVENETIPMDIYVAHLKEDALSPAARALMELLLKKQ